MARIPLWARQTARQVLTQHRALFDGRHTYDTVSPGAFRGLDRPFYDTMAQRLATYGFVPLGTVENRTHTQLYPNLRSCICLLRDTDGVVGAGLRHVRVGGWQRGAMRLGRWLGMVPDGPVDHRSISFTTELSDGSFLSTSNTYEVDAGFEDVPGIQCDELLAETPVEELLATHRETVAHRLGQQPRVYPIPARTLDDMLAAVHRWQDLINAHRQATGYVTEAQLIRTFGEQRARLVFAALQELVSGEQHASYA